MEYHLKVGIKFSPNVAFEAKTESGFFFVFGYYLIDWSVWKKQRNGNQ